MHNIIVRLRRSVEPIRRGAAGAFPRRMPLRAVVIALLPPILAACGDAALGGAGNVVVRDSAGVEIVESTAPVWGDGEGWRLSEAPVLEIGMAEGSPEYLFDRVVAALRMPDGRVAVANGGSQEIRFYDASGRHLGSSGGRGDGPGEFQNIGWMDFYRGDSLMVVDPRSGRESVLSPEGEFVRSFTLTRDSAGNTPRALGAFADGTLLGALSAPATNENLSSGMRSVPTIYGHLSGEEGALLDSIATLPGRESHLQIETNSIMVTTPLLGASPYAAMDGNSVFLGYGGTFEVRRYAADGTLQRVIRRIADPIPVTADQVARLIEARIEDVEPEEIRPSMRRVLESMPVPEFRPAFADLRADDEGNLWTQETVLPGEPNAWTVFDTDGGMLGQVVLPNEFRPLHIGDDFVLGVAADELGVQRVRMYGLEKD